jgi:hypothetical protein
MTVWEARGARAGRLAASRGWQSRRNLQLTESCFGSPHQSGWAKAAPTYRSIVGACSAVPDGTLDLLCRLLRQNRGILSKRGRERQFAKLTGDEVAKIEASYGGAFAG